MKEIFLYGGRSGLVSMVENADLTVREGLIRHLPKFRRFALSLTRNHADADDLVQAALERALRSIASYDPSRRLDTWVYKIIHNHWTDQMRQRSRRGQSVAIEEAVGLVGEDGRLTTETRDLSRRAREAIETMPADMRAVVLLVLVNGESYSEAANVLGIPVGTVMSRLHRARLFLVGRLEPDPETGAST